MTDRDTALEEIRVIREMILATHQRLRGAWIPFLVFGVLGVAASAASHLMLSRGLVFLIALPWMAFVAGGLLTIRMASRRHEEGDAGVSFVERMVISLWLGIGLAMLALWVAAFTGNIPVVGSIGTFVLLGLGLFASGRLIDYAPLCWAAGLWWVGAILAAVRPDLTFAIESVVIGVSYLLPAWGLYRQEADEVHAA